MKNKTLQKFLADLGYGSRRQITDWITQGRISIDDRTAKPGNRVACDSKIKIDGKIVAIKENYNNHKKPDTKILIYNKPIGEICTRSDPQKRATVFEKLPKLKNSRWVCVGRLDINTAGLLLFTTDGDLANALMHPSSEIEREYIADIIGKITQENIDTLLSGVKLEDGIAKFKKIKLANNKNGMRTYNIVLTEGRHREVRRLWESQNLRVANLARIRFGKIHLPNNLSIGRWRELGTRQIEQLRRTMTQTRPSRESVNL